MEDPLCSVLHVAVVAILSAIYRVLNRGDRPGNE